MTHLYRYEEDDGKLVLLEFPIVRESKWGPWIEVHGEVTQVRSSHGQTRYAHNSPTVALRAFLHRAPSSVHTHLAAAEHHLARAAAWQAAIAQAGETLPPRGDHPVGPFGKPHADDFPTLDTP